MPLTYIYSGPDRLLDHVVTTEDHVVDAAETIGVVALVAKSLDFLKQGAEIDGALAGLLMDFIGAVIVGQAHFVTKAEIHRVDKVLNADTGQKVSMVRGE